MSAYILKTDVFIHMYTNVWCSYDGP